MAAVLDPSRFTTVYCPFLDKNNINTYSPTALSNVAFSSLSLRALPVHENLQGGFFDCSALKMTKCQTHWKI